jgi:hypothetical protein
MCCQDCQRLLQFSAPAGVRKGKYPSTTQINRLGAPDLLVTQSRMGVHLACGRQSETSKCDNPADVVIYIPNYIQTCKTLSGACEIERLFLNCAARVRKRIDEIDGDAA